MKSIIFVLFSVFAMNAFACPIAHNLTDVEENWELELVSKHDQSQQEHSGYNIVSDIEDGNLTSIIILSEKQIKENESLKVLFNKDQIYFEDGKALDRSAEGVAFLNGELVRIDITMNDKKNQQITLGEFIDHISNDFSVKCKLKADVSNNKFTNSSSQSAIDN
jgi:hypothetical protein